MELQVRPSDPLIVTRWLDVTYIVWWLHFAVWGFLTSFIGLGTVIDITSRSYQSVWSGTIGTITLTSAIMATLVFFKTKWIRQITKKRIERVSVILSIVFILMYPVFLIIRAANGEPAVVGGAIVLGFGYTVFAFLRIFLLNTRIRGLKSATKAKVKAIEAGDISIDGNEVHR